MASPSHRLVYAKKATAEARAGVYLKHQKQNAAGMASALRISVGAAPVSPDLPASRQLVFPMIALAMDNVSMESACVRPVGNLLSVVVVVTRGYAWTRPVLGMVCVRMASVSALVRGRE